MSAIVSCTLLSIHRSPLTQRQLSSRKQPLGASNMLARLRALVSGTPEAVSCNQECTACPAGPATVTPHSHHVLLRLEPPDDTLAVAKADTWWPERVDDHPALVAVNTALATHAQHINGKVKLTAFDYLGNQSGKGGTSLATAEPAAGATCDVLLFPACQRLVAVPLTSIGEAVAAVVAQDAAALSAPESAGKWEQLAGLTLLICCHRSRDTRCGARGPPLAAALADQGASVYMTSHVGGHKWAGNVIVYGEGHSAHGHWFGGLSAAEAPEFFAALTSLPSSVDPAAHRQLRKWWRGRTGMSKSEQMEHYTRCGAEVKDIEDLPGAA